MRASQQVIGLINSRSQYRSSFQNPTKYHITHLKPSDQLSYSTPWASSQRKLSAIGFNSTYLPMDFSILTNWEALDNSQQLMLECTLHILYTQAGPKSVIQVSQHSIQCNSSHRSITSFFLYVLLCNKTAGELGHPRRRTILFLFLFLLLCNSLQCAGYYDSKGIRGIIQVDKYK